MRIEYDLNKCRQALFRQEMSQRDLIDEHLSASVISKFFRGESIDHKKTAAPIIRKLKLKMWGRGGVAKFVESEELATTEAKRQKTA